MSIRRIFPDRAAEEARERLVRVNECRDLDELVAGVRVARVAGAEVDGVDAVPREVGDVRPRLLRLDLEIARRPELLDEGRLRRHASGRRVPDHLEDAPSGTSDARYASASPGSRSGG